MRAYWCRYETVMPGFDWSSIRVSVILNPESQVLVWRYQSGPSLSVLEQQTYLWRWVSDAGRSAHSPVSASGGCCSRHQQGCGAANWWGTISHCFCCHSGSTAACSNVPAAQEVRAAAGCSRKAFGLCWLASRAWWKQPVGQVWKVLPMF